MEKYHNCISSIFISFYTPFFVSGKISVSSFHFRFEYCSPKITYYAFVPYRVFAQSFSLWYIQGLVYLDDDFGNYWQNELRELEKNGKDVSRRCWHDCSRIHFRCLILQVPGFATSGGSVESGFPVRGLGIGYLHFHSSQFSLILFTCLISHQSFGIYCFVPRIYAI